MDILFTPNDEISAISKFQAFPEFKSFWGKAAEILEKDEKISPFYLLELPHIGINKNST